MIKFESYRRYQRFIKVLIARRPEAGTKAYAKLASLRNSVKRFEEQRKTDSRASENGVAK